MTVACLFRFYAYISISFLFIYFYYILSNSSDDVVFPNMHVTGITARFLLLSKLLTFLLKTLKKIVFVLIQPRESVLFWRMRAIRVFYVLSSISFLILHLYFSAVSMPPNSPPPPSSTPTLCGLFFFLHPPAPRRRPINRSSRKGPSREFRKVVAASSDRVQKWALVSDHVVKQ